MSPSVCCFLTNSAISSVGTAILVNNSFITPPFIIKAVGNKDSILQRLLNESLLESLYERKKESNIDFKIAIKNSITIPVYNGDLKVDHINLVE
jgi:uncharacterized protein YlxW (UPF0749 family)